jgi:hypothetical protein
MHENRVVIHRKDGTLQKGMTRDFFPNKEEFHLELEEGGVSVVKLEELKAVFFVRNLAGRPEHHETYGDEIPGGGRKVEVTFEDGEVIVGFTSGYSPDRRGWFVLPADKESNNLRIFVLNSAVQMVRMLD